MTMAQEAMFLHDEKRQYVVTHEKLLETAIFHLQAKSLHHFDLTI
jgi:hypothetical protein